eukprot:832165-Amphidinium_carterae.1
MLLANKAISHCQLVLQQWEMAVATLSRICRGFVADLSRICRGFVADLLRCRGIVADLSCVRCPIIGTVPVSRLVI